MISADGHTNYLSHKPVLYIAGVRGVRPTARAVICKRRGRVGTRVLNAVSYRGRTVGQIVLLLG